MDFQSGNLLAARRSNTLMRSRFSQALINFVAVLFLLNTATAYGACCFSSADVESVAEMGMPCHQSENSESAEAPSDCCLMCLPVLQSSNGNSLNPVTYHADNPPENRNPTCVGASSRVPQAIRLYYRGRRRADRPDLPSVYRPRWSSMPVCVSCQPILPI